MKLLTASERGIFDYGWLRTAHSFSFGEYHNPKAMGYRSLRVLNEDVVAGGGGFPLHPHRDMEILSYVISGALEHEDSLGSRATIHAGEIQMLSAGKGMMHSERNSSQTEPVHFLQVWIVPTERGNAPSYAQRAIPEEQSVALLASSDGRMGSFQLRQDVLIWRIKVGGTYGAFRWAIGEGRGVWVQVLKGELELQSEQGAEVLRGSAGDGVEVSEAGELCIGGNGEALVFDLA